MVALAGRRRLLLMPGNGTFDAIIPPSTPSNAGSLSRNLWSISTPSRVAKTGALIDSVTNQSTGAGNTFTQTGTARPTFAQNVGPKKRDAALFDGVNDLLIGGPLSAYITNALGWVAFSFQPVAFINDEALTYRNDTIWGDSTAVIVWITTQQGAIHVGNWDGNQDVNTWAAPAAMLAKPMVVEWWHTGGSVYGRINGKDQKSTASGNTTTMTSTMNIGSVNAGVPSRFFSGYIYEWIIAPTVPDQQTRDKVVRDMGKWVGANV